jgi:hypothetical protein
MKEKGSTFFSCNVLLRKKVEQKENGSKARKKGSYPVFEALFHDLEKGPQKTALREEY